MAGAKGRSGSGGSRPGAGRPRSLFKPEKPKKNAGIPWSEVEKYARAHATEADIRTALDIRDEQLDAENLERLRQTIARGHARYRLDLRLRIRTRGERTNPKGDGSVNALALQARNTLDWDRQVPTQETEPDLGTARARLGDLLLRLAQQTSQVEGRHVSVAELLRRESEVAPAPDSPA